MENTKETTWLEEKEKSLEVLCNIKALNVLYQLKSVLEERMKIISRDWKEEVDYFCCKARAETISECLTDIDNCIIELTKKD